VNTESEFKHLPLRRIRTEVGKGIEVSKAHKCKKSPTQRNVSSDYRPNGRFGAEPEGKRQPRHVLAEVLRDNKKDARKRAMVRKTLAQKK